MTAIPQPSVRTKIPAKSVALPIEHGAWGFLLEPLLAGVLLAPSLAAVFITLFVTGSFLSRQPLKFVAGDLLKRRWLPRSALAARFLLIFGAIAFAGLVGSVFFAPAHSFVPFAVVLPLVVYLIVQDIGRQSRELWPELAAAVALSSSIAVVALAGGVKPAVSAALWALMAARLIPSVIYVRERLRLEKGKPYGRLWSTFLHLAALALAAALYVNGLGSALTAMMAAFLFFRAVYGLSGRGVKMTAKAIGVREVIYGILYALSLVLGYHLSV